MKKENKLKRQYEIPFAILKDGIHHFDFQIDKTLFEYFNSFDFVSDGKCEVNVELDKKPTLLKLYITIKGSITTNCDRCTFDLNVDIESENSVVFKFGDVEMEETEEILVLHHHEHKLNLLNILYEFIFFAIPPKLEHPIEDCNQEMIDKLNEYIITEKSEPDPRWDALINLK